MHVKGFALKTFEKFNIRKEREREKGERMRERETGAEEPKRN